MNTSSRGLKASLLATGVAITLTGCGSGDGSPADGAQDPSTPVTTYYRDADGDGYGNPAVTLSATTQPAGYVADNSDCNDGNSAIHPGASEITGDGLDNNCDGQVDEAPVALFLNDTGITFGGNSPGGNNATCIGETIAQQDCSHGRDATDNDGSDGHAGFSFTKLSATGASLPASASEWACVRDNVTGLIWEVKRGGNGITGDEGLHDTDDKYNWYNTNPATNGGSDGYANDDNDICHGYNANSPSTYCNTEAFVTRVNAAGLCGANDWRLPTRAELVGLMNLNRASPAIDTNYFPNTRNTGYYWTSSPSAYQTDYAWHVSISDGGSFHSFRHTPNYVRLVRDEQ